MRFKRLRIFVMICLVAFFLFVATTVAIGYPSSQQSANSNSQINLGPLVVNDRFVVSSNSNPTAPAPSPPIIHSTRTRAS